MDYLEIRKITLLSMQKALLGMIYSEIRAITIGFESTKKLTVIYYLDRDPNEDDYDNISEVTAEVLSDINFSELEEKCIYSREILSNLNNLDSWVYMRKED